MDDLGIGTLVGCYLSYPNLIQPKEVSRAFKLFDEWCNLDKEARDNSEQVKELRTICTLMATSLGKGVRWSLSSITDDTNGGKITMLSFVEPYNAESVFKKGETNE